MLRPNILLISILYDHVNLFCLNNSSIKKDIAKQIIFVSLDVSESVLFNYLYVCYVCFRLLIIFRNLFSLLLREVFVNQESTRKILD